MASLDRSLRRDLESTVKKARRVAEAGARNAVAQLGVGETEAPRHLSAEQRALRNRLRAHGRQLGDRRDTRTGVQDTARLVQECAYEHWHRMLFARFLAETDLLIEPGSGVAITFDEVRELAREKATDWLELASDYAERMLPQIFRKDDPVLQIALPLETRSELEDLLKALSNPVFEADDSLGWVYQFWQADKKDEVNKSEVKIGADELPAVTQLFTEDYMVLFLLHNTLGAWWAAKVLGTNPVLASSAPNEAALRTACKVGDTEWTYLRFVRDKADGGAEGPWRPAAGTFEGWPKVAKGITVLDPCMGSGHFVVFALPILVALRMAEDGLSQTAAVDAVLRDNLFGLEIDPRCTQIAAFNLAFAAWRRVGHRPLPRLNLACSGLAIGVTKAEWLRLGEKAVTAADPAAKRDLLGVEQNLLTAGLEERVKNGLEALYDLFAKAPWLGSLIDPRHVGADIFREGFDKLEPLLSSILAVADTDEAREMAAAAQGMAKAAELLARQFTLVTTNVPFLGRGRQDETLQAHLSRFFDDAKSDLACAMLRRLIAFTAEAASIALVTPQSWLFLKTYTSLRDRILRETTLNVVVSLGPRAFETVSGEVVNTALIELTATPPKVDAGFVGLDANDGGDPSEKAAILVQQRTNHSLQALQRANPNHRISINASVEGPLLKAYADSWQGLVTSDTQRYLMRFWELPERHKRWEWLISTPKETSHYVGREFVLRWEQAAGSLHLDSRAHNFPPKTALGKKGVLLSQISSTRATLYTGEIFNDLSVPIIPHKEEDLAAIYALCTDDGFIASVRAQTESLQIRVGYFLNVPFDLAYWKRRAEELFPNGLPKPHSNDPTQWLFKGNPRSSNNALHIACSRLLGYRWPRQTGSGFMDCPALGPDGLGKHADNDGVVCLTATKGEAPAHERLIALLADAFGAEWSAAKLASQLTDVGFAGKTLDDWLREGFFEQHCALFHQRPFVWHIWDGRRDGFHALVNCHRLAAPNGEGRRTLEKLIYSYLGDWIDRQRADQKAGVEGADARLAHAEHLKAQLIKILEGEPPYDIFVRWKPLREQPIGWDPDIDDGVRMNIRPFMTARTLNNRAASASILRSTPKIKWDKDRGKEPLRDKDDYPWFWGWNESSADFPGGAEFDGNRWNDLHYSRAAKQSARDRHRAPIGGKA